MGLYRPSELQAYLNALQTTAKKGLSQNFLIDGNILNKIVQTACVSENDHVVEIGPGPGALTETLLKCGASVVAIEADSVFAQGLSGLSKTFPKLQVIHGDALKFNWHEELTPIKKGWKVVANLPYQITTPLLAMLLPLYPLIESITVMVQKEVAERLVAKPKSKEFSRLTILSRFYSEPAYSFTVSPHCFTPKPKVTSAVVHFQLQKPPPVTNQTAFFDMVRRLFSQKRKMVRASLGSVFGKDQVIQALAVCSLPDTVRPQELSLESLIALYEALASSPSTPQD